MRNTSTHTLCSQGKSFPGAARAALLFAAALALAAPAAAWAQAAARADFISGAVSASAGSGAQRALEKGSEVFSADTVKTGTDGRAQLRFTDGGVVSLMPSSTFIVHEYQTDGNQGSLVFGLISGGLRTITGSIGKTRHEDYELRTPVGTLGIRGTEFTAVLDSLGSLRVHVGRGRVMLSNDSGQQELAQGENGVMELGSAPQITDTAPEYASIAGPAPLPDPTLRSDPLEIELPLAAMGAIQRATELQTPVPPPEPIAPEPPAPAPEPPAPAPEPPAPAPEPPTPAPEPPAPEPAPIPKPIPTPLPTPAPVPEPKPPAPEPKPPAPQPPAPQPPAPTPKPPVPTPPTPITPPITDNPGGGNDNTGGGGSNCDSGNDGMGSRSSGPHSAVGSVAGCDGGVGTI